MAQYLCLVTVISNVDQQPPFPPPHPSHPIMLPGMPGWGGGGGQPPYPDQGLPPFATHLPVVPPGGAWPQPPRPPGVPTHPIYNPPYPDQGLPGAQPRPEHPIYIPPEGAPPPLASGGRRICLRGLGGGMGPGVKPQPKPSIRSCCRPICRRPSRPRVGNRSGRSIGKSHGRQQRVGSWSVFRPRVPWCQHLI